jgi:NACHT, LRR and PYD domains-containing protein 3
VVSKPNREHSGVIQYDYSKAVCGRKLECTDTVNKPPYSLLRHMNQLERKQLTESEDDVLNIVEGVLK